MGKIVYSKKPISLDEQVKTLIKRGVLGEKDVIYDIVKFVGYYRLTGFLYHFKQKDCENYNSKITIDDIWALYTFDRRLRLLALEAIARIEVWLRSQLADKASKMYEDAFNYIQLWEDKNPGFRNACELDLKHAQNSLHLKHFYQKYSNEYPPIWMALEVFSFGTTCQYLSKTSPKIAGQIAAELGVNRQVLINWMQILRTTRNICAHNQRLWDVNIDTQLNLKTLQQFKELDVVAPLVDLYKQEPVLNFIYGSENKISRTPPYVAFCLCVQILSTIRPQNTWKARVLDLFKQYQQLIQTHLVGLSYDSYHMFGFSKSTFRDYSLWSL